MPVRKTESRLPQLPGFTVDDLGQHAVSGTNPNIILISYLSSPVNLNIEQNYVVIVDDATVGPNVSTYEWTFNNNGISTISTTPNGVTSFTPAELGSLTVTVNVKNSANTILHSVILDQQVVARNLELEQLIEQENSRGPSVGNPEVSRVVINGLRLFVDGVASPVNENALNRLLLSLAYAHVSGVTAAKRNEVLEKCTAAFETGTPDQFFTLGQTGIGINRAKPHVAAMFLMNGAAPFIPLTEIPAGASASVIKTTLATIGTSFNALSEATRIDIFNVLRFPKSNIRICALILTGLKDKYVAGQAFSALPGNRPIARRLITEYEIGPYVPPATGTRDLTNTSDTIFNLTLLPVWKISVSTLINPAGLIDPQTRLFGIPEPIPERTFLAETGIFPNDADFIESARKYHNAFNITFKNVDSLEDIINDLQASSIPLNHCRIFTHATPDALALSLFDGGSGYVSSEHLDGFVYGELEGAIGILSNYFDGGRGYIYGEDKADNFLAFLRGQSHASLTPFGLQTNPLTPDQRHLVRRYIDIWLLRIQGSVKVTKGSVVRNITTSEQNTIFIPFVNVLIRLVEAQIIAAAPTITAADFTALKTAILGVTTQDLNFNAVPYFWDFPDDPFPDNTFEDLSKDFTSTVRALPPGNTFMDKLMHVRDSRFTTNSTIDIRGCHAGEIPLGTIPPPPFLVTIQKFFGKAGTLPSVNGPDWFQSFQLSFAARSLADNTAIDNLFDNDRTFGGIALTSAEVNADFATWSRLANVDDQFTFFTNLFSAPATLLDFAGLLWKTWRTVGAVNGIPPLNLYSSRTDDLVQLTLGETVNRLRENFGAAGTNLAAAVITRLNNLQPFVAQFIQISRNVAAFSGSNFSPFYDDLKAIANGITAISGYAPPATTLVDPAMPNPLGLPQITGYVTNISAHLNTILTTDIGPIFTAISTAVQATNAKRYYYFNLRLPLRVQQSNPTTSLGYVVFYKNGFVKEALKSYMKCQWMGNPSQLADLHSFIDGIAITEANSAQFLITASFNERDDTTNPNALAPLPDYNAHINST